MADTKQIIENIVSGLLTGGTSAATTFLAVFRDIKKRLSGLEEKVGTPDPKAGIYLALSVIEDSVKKLRREVDSWEDDPPDWAVRLLARARTSSTNDLSGQIQFEETVNRNLREFRDRIKRAEDDLEAKIERIEKDVGKHLNQGPTTLLISREEYIKDSQQRAEEMLRIREQIATTNGLLRGVMSALGYIDTDKTKSGR